MLHYISATLYLAVSYGNLFSPLGKIMLRFSACPIEPDFLGRVALSPAHCLTYISSSHAQYSNKSTMLLLINYHSKTKRIAMYRSWFTAQRQILHTTCIIRAVFRMIFFALTYKMQEYPEDFINN